MGLGVMYCGTVIVLWFSKCNHYLRMDRVLTKDEIRAGRRKLWLRFGIPAAVVIAALLCLPALVRSSIARGSLTMGTADMGDIESSIPASGKVVPAFEQIITSPITSRVVEIYGRAGDKLEAGTPLLRLDLEETEAEISRERDSRQKLVYSIEQQELANETELTNLEMEIKVKEMALNRLEAEVENERRLDALGSGTGDRVREAELAYKTGCVELDQLRRRLANERRMRESAVKAQRLDLSISDRNLAGRLRTLEDARLKSPRKATLTYIINSVGRQVSQGEKVAVIADLTRFKVDAEISEANARMLSTGARASVMVSKKVYPGTVINVSPVANQGTVTFSVVFDDSTAVNLRSGLTADVYVLKGVRENVVRLPIGPYYSRGAGEYDMYVEHSPGELEKRKVELGDAGYNFVEVKSGLQPGDKVVLNDMSSYKKSKYKIKQ